MRSILLYVVYFIFFTGFGQSITENSHLPCGDNSWVAYKDEKCFKLIDEFATHDKAEKICNQLSKSNVFNPTLVSIKSEDEQEYLNKFLFEQMKVMETVWIAAKKSEGKSLFLWNDDSLVNYNNWAEGSPIDGANRNCVEIRSPNAIKYKRSIFESLKNITEGKWFNVKCQKRNLVFCQKLQSWSFLQLQKTFLNGRKKLQDSLEDVRKQLNNQESIISKQQTKIYIHESIINSQQSTINNHESTISKQLSEINKLKEQVIPLGFIYIQLPNQANPWNLWPKTEWKDISSDYAGLFFRVLGSGSAGFGETQSENSPRLTSVTYKVNHVYSETISVPSGGWSGYIRTGGAVGYRDGINFYVSGGEVRPRNKAVRIWIRTK